MSDTTIKTELTLKQRRFIDAYLGSANGNATEAVRLAGYGGRLNTLRSIGSENLTKPNILAEIRRRLAENTLSSGDVLSRLSDHAKGTLKHFVYQSGDRIVLDLLTEDAQQNIHLLKKIKQKVRSGGKAEDRWEETETEFEIHDPQAALVQLGRYHKLFTDNVQHSGDPNKPITVKVVKGVSMDDL